MCVRGFEDSEKESPQRAHIPLRARSHITRLSVRSTVYTIRRRVKDDIQKETDATLKNPIEFREWWKVLMRVWRPAFTRSEFLVACFVFDRTAAWGKEWEVITPSQMLGGVTGKDGTVYAPGLQMSAPTLLKAVNGLLDKKAVLRRRKGARWAYALNYEYRPTEPQEPMPLPVPKRLKPGADHKVSLQKPPQKGKETLPINIENNKCFAKDHPQAAGGPPLLAKVNAQLKALADATMQTATAKRQAKQHALTDTGCMTMWQDACRAAMPREVHLSLTKTDTVILRRYLLRKFGRNGTEAGRFIRWVAERWLTIRDEKFAWMNNTPPSVPSIRFLVRFAENFEDAWNDRERVERLASMSVREREVDRLMRKKGMSRQAAEAETDARLAKSAQAQEHTKAAKAAHAAISAMNRMGAESEQAQQRNLRWQRIADSRKASTSTNSTLPDFDD